MAKKMSSPTLEQLMAQQQDVARRLAAVRSGLLGLENVGTDAYLKYSGEKKVEKKDLPSYTTTFDTEYNKIKDIKMVTGADAKTSDANDEAFFVFNPNSAAVDKTQEIIGAVEENNKLYAEQMQRSAEFLKSEGQKEKEKVLDMYLTDYMNKNTSIRDGYITSNDAGFSRAAWTNSRNKKVIYQTLEDPKTRRRTTVPIMSYALSKEEADKRRTMIKAIETERFSKDKKVRDEFAKRYEEFLSDEQTRIARQLTKLNKKK